MSSLTNSFKLAAFTLLFCTSAQAYSPMVICGMHNSSGNIEIDNVLVERGGTHRNQLVLRNRDILMDFIQKGALTREEINERGEFVTGGFNHYSSYASIEAGSRNGRAWRMIPEGNGYTLSVRVIASDQIHLSEPIASFHFNDCQTFAEAL